MTPDSGGTAPAFHRTSLLCPRGHLKKLKRNMQPLEGSMGEAGVYQIVYLNQYLTGAASARVSILLIPAAITSWARSPSRWVIGKASPLRQQSMNFTISAL